MTTRSSTPSLFVTPVAIFLLLLFICLCLPGGLGTATPAAAAGLIEISELLAHPEQYDHQDIIVTGKVMNVQLATNRQGQPAYGFLLQDQAGTLKVVSLGQLEVHEGDQVIVEGVFSRLRQVGRTIVYNEIKALSVKPLTRLNPDFVG
jgi:cytochrome c-type biogenesis protein CcmE